MSLKKRILVIEDDLPIQDALKSLLEDEGYLVDVAGDGEQALQWLRLAPALPDLILLDLMMPNKDGFQFRIEQRQEPKFSAIPVVIMSADGNVQQKLKRAEAAAYLKKPVDVDNILATVKRFA